MLAVDGRLWEPSEAWREEAACAPLDPAVFFPESEEPEASAEAKIICETCPVRELCLEYALATNQSDGVWGGLDAGHRRRMRRRMRDRARRRAS